VVTPAEWTIVSVDALISTDALVEDGICQHVSLHAREATACWWPIGIDGKFSTVEVTNAPPCSARGTSPLVA
jgi:hypothetical protein